MLQIFKNGQTSIILRAKLLNSSSTVGAGLAGLTSASAGLIISTMAHNEAAATAYTVAASNVETIVTLGTYAAPTASKCRFKEVDATNHPGLYEFQFADARFAVASARSLIVSVSGAANLQQADFLIQLTQVDFFNATTMGLTNLDAAISSRMATFTQPPGFLAATFPGTVASPTNITAATGITVTTNNDKTGYGLSSAAVQAIWDAATTALTTAGSIGKKLADWVVGTIDTYTGNTKQTGDNFARLGAPAGASVSADIAAIQAKTTNLPAAPAAVGDIPTAVQNADTLLDRNMATGTDSGSSTVRTVRQALRFLRNKWSISGTTLTVTKEDDTTASFTATVTTDAAAVPIVGNDPA